MLVCMKVVEFLQMWRCENFCCVVFKHKYTSNIPSLGCFVFMGDDNSSYSKLVNKTYNAFRFFCLFCFWILSVGAVAVINCNMTLQYDSIYKSVGEKCKQIQFYKQYCMCWLKNMKSFCIHFSCMFLYCGTYCSNINVMYFLAVLVALHQHVKVRLSCMKMDQNRKWNVRWSKIREL